MRRIRLLLALYLSASFYCSIAQGLSQQLGIVVQTDFRSEVTQSRAIPSSICAYDGTYGFVKGGGAESVGFRNGAVMYMEGETGGDCALVLKRENDTIYYENGYYYDDDDVIHYTYDYDLALRDGHIYYGLQTPLYLKKGVYNLEFTAQCYERNLSTSVYFYPFSGVAEDVIHYEEDNGVKTQIGSFRQQYYVNDKSVESKESTEWTNKAILYSYNFSVPDDGYYVLEWCGGYALISNFRLSLFDKQIVSNDFSVPFKTDFRSETVITKSAPISICAYDGSSEFIVGDGYTDGKFRNGMLFYADKNNDDDCALVLMKKDDKSQDASIFFGLNKPLNLNAGKYLLIFSAFGYNGESEMKVFMYPKDFNSQRQVLEKATSDKTLIGSFVPPYRDIIGSLNSLDSLDWAPFIVSHSFVFDIKTSGNYVLECSSGYAMLSNFSITAYNEDEEGSKTFADYYPNGFVDSPLPDAALLYDFEGNGKKNSVSIEIKEEGRNSDYYSIEIDRIGDYTTYFSKNLLCQWNEYLYYSYYKNPLFFEDINKDGVTDIGSYNGSYISDSKGYSLKEGCIIIPNGDLNNDGRLDYIRRDYIGYQQPDGTFKEEYMQVMTEEEYDSKFDPDVWVSNAPEQKTTGISVHHYSTPSFLMGVVQSARSIMRVSGGNSEQTSVIYSDFGLVRSSGIGATVDAPTKAIDLNGDNYVDLVNENAGIIYYNMGDGKWIKCDIGGAVYTADLNSDGIQDFIMPGKDLYSIIYRGNGEYEKQLLYSNISVDKEVYCYDFDHDGDVDILVTFSGPYNETGYAYTMFFSNDGDGNFTQEDEQDYGDLKLCFSNCQDVDGDGYMDMLAFDYCDYSCFSWWNEEYTEKGEANVYLLKGKPSLEFGAPELLVETKKHKISCSGNHRINAEDIDGDGKIDVWVSGESYDINTDVKGLGYVHVNSNAKENTRPLPPSKPVLTYDNGILLVTWGNGSDAESPTIDLTYALKIGTTPGGNDILSAHANADGVRRNFLDGNMRKNHSYIIDLSSYNPSTVYVSVQSIDNQHCGSAWSEEATVEHTALPASFVAEKNTINLNEQLQITYTPLANGYSQSWNIEDGKIVESDGSKASISFSVPGEKTVTHNITGGNGVSASYSAVINVLPVVIDTLLIGSYNDNDNSSVRSEIESKFNSATYADKAWADYNLDGYLDYVSYGDRVINRGRGNHSYEKAPGVWNTGLEMSGAKWLDWDHDGFLDCTYYFYDYPYGDNSLTCYYLLHNGRNNLTQKKEDKGLYFLFFDRIRKRNTYFMNFEDSVKNDLKSKYGKEDDGYFGLWNGLWNFTLDKPDINHCGYPSDIIQYVHTVGGGLYVYDNYIISRRNNGELFATEVVVNNETERVPLYGIQYNIDMDHNGFVDVITFYKEDELSSKSKGLSVYFNFGNGVFEKVNIPFEIELNDAALIHSNYYHEYDCKIADFNNDGYYDIFSVNTKDAPYIMFNHENQYFAKPEVLPLGDLMSFNFGGDYDLADINNDGYIDIINRWQTDKTGEQNLYVFFMGENGVVSQGFCLLPPVNSSNYHYSYNEIYQSDCGQWVVPTRAISIFDGENFDIYNFNIFSFSPENQKPSAPTGVRVVKTEEGMLIEWNDAEDDHTPAVQMRYNLSVKHKGQTGAGSYVISPQNGGNANAAFLPGYDYIAATRYLIPNSVLTAGEYEIQVQAIDLCNEMGAFSDVVEINYDRLAISAPTLANAGHKIEVRYMGETNTGTPVWDFDGADEVSGSGFGPYSVKWESAGTKTINLALDGNTYTHMLYVDKNTAEVELPEYMMLGVPATVEIPDDMTANWSIIYGGDKYSADSDGVITIVKGLGSNTYMVSMKVDGNRITVTKTINCNRIMLRLNLINKYGSEKEFIKEIQLISEDVFPSISYVSPDENGHNVINLNMNPEYFPKVRIMKETNVRNRFVELDVVNADEVDQYTDMSSNANIKAERYAVIGIMEFGTQSPQSEAHQSVHAVINRGMLDNVWNLMWSQYQGADVVTYNILRGTSPSDMSQIASVSSSMSTYTDFAPAGEQQYYAIEFVMDGGSQASSASRSPSRGGSGSIGRSNVVVASSARSVIYADRMSVLSANGLYELTEDKPSLFLYAEIFPVEATYKNVKWEITSGEKLATIDNSGLLTALKTGKSGTVTVKATAVDGSGVSATKTISVAAIGGGTFKVVFVDVDGTVLKTRYVEYGGSVTPPDPAEHYGYDFDHWEGDYSNITEDIIIYAVYTDADGVVSIKAEGISKETFKTIENGKLIITLPDGSKFNSVGVKVE